MTNAPPVWISGPTSGNVDVPSTPLVAATDLSHFEALVWIVVNDGAGTITALVEAGDIPNVWDAGQSYTVDVPAGTSRSIEVAANLHTLWRMSGTNTVLGAARWGVRGVRRALPSRSGGMF